MWYCHLSAHLPLTHLPHSYTPPPPPPPPPPPTPSCSPLTYVKLLWKVTHLKTSTTGLRTSSTSSQGATSGCPQTSHSKPLHPAYAVETTNKKQSTLLIYFLIYVHCYAICGHTNSEYYEVSVLRCCSM